MKRASLDGLVVAAFVGALSGCSVEFLSSAGSFDSVSNSCKLDVDCGPNATCTSGLCYAKSGVIDEVLLEVVPEANSSSGGLSFLSMQSGLTLGDRDLKIDLLGQTSFITQVVIKGDDLKTAGCKDYVLTGAQTIPARIEFSRVSAIGGVPILGLSSVPFTIETTMNSGSWNAPVSLVPGTYDIYVQPLTTMPNCELAPRILRGIDIPQTDPSVPPALLDLPTPATLNGEIQLAPLFAEGWTVDIIEPEEGRVISTAWKLAPMAMTNFKISYQPLTPSPTRTGTHGTAPGGPLVRISPPTGMEETAPVVYWDLAAADLAGDGTCKLDMTAVPPTSTLVNVAGQIQGKSEAAPDSPVTVRANLQFSSISLAGADGLTAVFKRTVTTNAMGAYTTQLFPGQYRVVVIPSVEQAASVQPPARLGDPTPIGAAALPWAIQEEQWTIPANAPTLSTVLRQKRMIAGHVFAGVSTEPDAPGATINAIPSITPSQVGTLKGVLAKVPTLPQNASISVGQGGGFSLPLDPGDFDISIRTPESSNFAWWVWPAAEVTLPDLSNTTRIEPRIPFPVPLEGIITVPDKMGPIVDSNGERRANLRGAAVRAYAKVPTGTGVTKVGEARTDDMGRYRLRLPPSFGGP